MKRIFLDTNFIIDFLLREEYKPACIDLLAKGKENGYRFYISFFISCKLRIYCQESHSTGTG